MTFEVKTRALESAVEFADAALIIENAVGELYRGFYRLRKSGQYQREYDEMGAILNMLMQDRMHLLKTYGVKP
jgi:hypothetical protein